MLDKTPKAVLQESSDIFSTAFVEDNLLPEISPGCTDHMCNN